MSNSLSKFFIGEVPVAFLGEVVFRIFFLFLLIIISMRLLGRRMSSTMNRTDLAAAVSIAAAVGVPMQDPIRGLLQAVIIAFVIVGITKAINWFSFKNKKLEKTVQGNFNSLIRNGVIDWDNMKQNNLSQQRIFAQLRSENIVHLGQVQRMYIESGGNFTVVRFHKPKPGLSIIPEWDKDFFEQESISNTHRACGRCGWLNETNTKKECPVCGSVNWIKAVIS